MLTSIIIFFSLAALLGLLLLTYILKDKYTPKAITLIHGSFASLGLILLIIYSFSYEAPLISLILFILAAMGGMILTYLDVTGKFIPKWLAVGHGVTALIGLVILIAYSF